jgi:hypothetical protein
MRTRRASPCWRCIGLLHLVCHARLFLFCGCVRAHSNEKKKSQASFIPCLAPQLNIRSFDHKGRVLII